MLKVTQLYSSSLPFTSLFSLAWNTLCYSYHVFFIALLPLVLGKYLLVNESTKMRKFICWMPRMGQKLDAAIKKQNRIRFFSLVFPLDLQNRHEKSKWGYICQLYLYYLFLITSKQLLHGKWLKITSALLRDVLLRYNLIFGKSSYFRISIEHSCNS